MQDQYDYTVYNTKLQPYLPKKMKTVVIKMNLPVTHDGSGCCCLSLSGEIGDDTLAQVHVRSTSEAISLRRIYSLGTTDIVLGVLV